MSPQSTERRAGDAAARQYVDSGLERAAENNDRPQAATAPTIRMSRSEREDLQRLVRQREKVLKSAAKQRSAELIADFENQIGQVYSFDQDETWAAAVKAVEQEVARARARVASRCAKLRIPKRFAPDINFHWYGRGENGAKERRAELRKMATKRIEAIEAEAIVKIELASVTAQTEIATHGLTSEVARDFIARLPSIESLMPTLALSEVAGEAEPPIAEQLVSPGALRVRKHRARQAGLRNGSQALRNETCNADEAPKPAPAPDDGDDPLALPSFLRRAAS